MYYNEKGILKVFQELLKNKVYLSVLSSAYAKIYSDCNEDEKLLLDENYTLDEDFYIFTGNDESVKDIIFRRYSNWWFGYPEDNSDFIFSIQLLSYNDNPENQRIESVIDLHIFANRSSYEEGIWLAKIVKSLSVHESDNNHLFDGVVITRLQSVGVMSMNPENYYFVSVNNGSYYPFKITYNIIYGGH